MPSNTVPIANDAGHHCLRIASFQHQIWMLVGPLRKPFLEIAKVRVHEKRLDPAAPKADDTARLHS